MGCKSESFRLEPIEIDFLTRLSTVRQRKISKTVLFRCTCTTYTRPHRHWHTPTELFSDLSSIYIYIYNITCKYSQCSTTALNNCVLTSPMRNCNSSLTTSCSSWNKRNTPRRVFIGTLLISVWICWPVSNWLKRCIKIYASTSMYFHNVICPNCTNFVCCVL